MANIYLRSTNETANVDDGSTWALAKTTLAGAIAIASAGDTIFVSDNHAESAGSSISNTLPGTAASPVQLVCVNDAAEPPTALAITGQMVTTASAAHITLHGFGVVYGFSFLAGNGGGKSCNFTIGTTNALWIKFVSCLVKLNGASANRVFLHASATQNDDSLIEFVDTDISFTNASQGIVPKANFVWNGGSALGTAPTSLFVPTTGAPYGNAKVVGVDLSLLASGSSLVNVGVAIYGSYTFINCKLGASVTATTGTHPGQGGVTVELINCDSGDTNYRNEWWGYQGNVITETTIVRTGGANDGTTAISRKMTSSANSKFYSPLVFSSAIIWNDNTGSAITATVHIVTDNVTLTDKECWLEVEYMGTSGSTLQSLANDHASDDNMYLGTGANQTTSTESWTTSYFTVSSANATAAATYTNNGNTYTVQETISSGLALRCDGTGAPQASGTLTKASGTGDATITFSAVTYLTTPVKQQLAVTFTPQEKGPIRFRVMLAKPSVVVYVCPEVGMSDQSSAAQYQIAPDVYLNAPAVPAAGTLFNIIGAS
jgi:hypothetical protein